MSEDLTSIGIIALCAIVGFVIVWTFLSARAADKKSPERDDTDDRPGPDERPEQ